MNKNLAFLALITGLALASNVHAGDKKAELSRAGLPTEFTGKSNRRHQHQTLTREALQTVDSLIRASKQADDTHSIASSTGSRSSARIRELNAKKAATHISAPIQEVFNDSEEDEDVSSSSDSSYAPSPAVRRTAVHKKDPKRSNQIQSPIHFNQGESSTASNMPVRGLVDREEGEILGNLDELLSDSEDVRRFPTPVPGDLPNAVNDFNNVFRVASPLPPVDVPDLPNVATPVIIADLNIAGLLENGGTAVDVAANIIPEIQQQVPDLNQTQNPAPAVGNQPAPALAVVPAVADNASWFSSAVEWVDGHKIETGCMVVGVGVGCFIIYDLFIKDEEASILRRYFRSSKGELELLENEVEAILATN